MATHLPHFEVDKTGMARVFARKGKAFVVTELIQNAWDEDATHVDVTLEWLGNGKAKLTVEDDNPEGFANLAHAYTLFAESAKKSDTRKRGRFNLGEKLVIAMADNASISTTKGTVVFDGKGRVMLPKKRKAGSVFTGVLKMSRADYDEVVAVVNTLIPPQGIATTFNMDELVAREPVKVFEATLRTEHADDEGRLKPTTRKTQVELYDPLPGETASIYEMGIPVVVTGDRFHVNVQQKIPLNLDRDNVTPAYLQDLRALVLNNAYDAMGAADLKAAWVTNAMEDENADPTAVKAAITGRFGEKVVIADPTDPEANNRATAAGFTVIPGGALPKGAWANVKAGEIALPAGRVMPSPHPEEGTHTFMNPDHYPEPVLKVVTWVRRFSYLLTGVSVDVGIVRKARDYRAHYARVGRGEGRMAFYYDVLGYRWFERALSDPEALIDLTIHELAHHRAGNHLSDEYLDELTRLGAKAVMLALSDPDEFDVDAVQALAVA